MILVTAAFAIIATLGAVLGCVLAVWRRFWVPTEGVIVDADLRKRRDKDGRYICRYNITYTYSIGGVTYRGSDVIPIEVSYDEESEAIEHVRTGFDVGQRIAVYHPRTMPQINAARRDVVGLQKMIFAALIMVFVFVLLYYFDRVVSE